MRALRDRFSISPAHLILGLASVLCLPGNSSAATRTIQFAGVATTFGDRALPNLTQWVACTVMVANTGDQPQYIESIRFNAFHSAGGDLRAHTSDATTHTVTLEEVYRPGDNFTAPSCTKASGGSGCVGTGNPFGAGGMYVATVQTRQFAQVGFAIVPCSGSVTVSDVTPNQPGSMVAAGAISFTSEQAITGGQFMGAMYLSGSHYSPTSTTSAQLANYRAFGTQNLPVGKSAMQMNIYCQQACESGWFFGPQAQSCAAMCGGGANETIAGNAQGDLYMGNAHQMRNFSGGYIEEFNTQSVGIEVDYLTDNATSAYAKEPIGAGGEKSGYGPSRIAGHPFHDNGGLAVPNNSIFRGLIRHANPHFAGGHVVEMIMGPYETICSGNRGYFDVGGEDFDHGDSVLGDGTDTTFKIARPTVPGSGPPERLYCSHAHSNDSPFGYVAQSSPFTIWGGNAF